MKEQAFNDFEVKNPDVLIAPDFEVPEETYPRFFHVSKPLKQMDDGRFLLGVGKTYYRHDEKSLKRKLRRKGLISARQQKKMEKLSRRAAAMLAVHKEHGIEGLKQAFGWKEAQSA